MSDLLEQSLREVYAVDAASYDTTDAARRLSKFDYRSRTTRRRRFWAAAGASGAALAGGIIATILLLLSGTPLAYAGWTYMPSAPTPAAIATTTAKCQQLGVGSLNREDVPADPFSGQPVLTEARGVYTATIDVTAGWVFNCLYSGEGVSTNSGVSMRDIVTAQAFGPLQTAPEPDQLTAPYTPMGGRSSDDTLGKRLLWSPGSQGSALIYLTGGGGYGNYTLGQAGSSVSAVTFSFDNQAPVQATVENGWYFAWWPWDGEPTSVQVTTTSGTLTSPMVTSDTRRGPLPTPGCDPGATGCVFANSPTATSTTTTATPNTTTSATTTTAAP